ncbi:MAG TPA: ABC transporter permease subunit [Clostridia bacterium]|nr:ABC transporter permease subunit [Clostridia bacterium]
MLLPVVVFFALFHYWPMYGAQIAFRNFNIRKGVMASPWVGFKHFQTYFSSYYFGRLIGNTLLINLYNVIFGFPAPILLALMLNEVRSLRFKRAIQTITYMPHFISIVVICGILTDFLAMRGVINQVLIFFGGTAKPFLLQPESFRTIYTASGIWQEVGWGSILYLSALTAIDEQLYEAARIDGAGRMRQTWHVTLPGIAPTIVIMLIMRLGRMMSVGSEKVLLLYNPNTYETADVISTFVYRKGLLEANYSYSAAVGLLNSVVNFTLLVTFNKLSRKLSSYSLW